MKPQKTLRTAWEKQTLGNLVYNILCAFMLLAIRKNRRAIKKEGTEREEVR